MKEIVVEGDTIAIVHDGKLFISACLYMMIDLLRYGAEKVEFIYKSESGKPYLVSIDLKNEKYVVKEISPKEVIRRKIMMALEGMGIKGNVKINI